MTEHEMSLAEKIRAELGVSTWQWLQPHDEREALFWVTGAELVEVAVAIAQDNSAAVQGFLARGELKRSEGPAILVSHSEPWRGFGILEPRWGQNKLHFVRLTPEEKIDLQREVAEIWAMS